MDASPAPLPRSVDCLVIGAGVVGAAVAQRLARAGLRVAVLDTAPGIGGGCSYANAALLAPHHVTPLATPALLREAPIQMLRRPAAVRVRPDRPLLPWLARLAASATGATARTRRLRELAVDSTQLHLALAEAGLSPTLRQTGAVDVYLRRPRRPPAQALTPQQLRQFEPSLTAVVTGSHDEREWTLESRSFVTSMLQDAREHGAEVRFASSVHQLAMEQGRVVGAQTTGGRLRAGSVVLAAGLGTVQLAAQAGLRVPLRGGRGHVVDVAVPQSEAPRIPVRIKEHRVVVTPLADRVRVCGSIEFGPEDRPVDPRRGQQLLDVAATVLPGLRDRPVLDRWSGERPCTPDGMPVIGASRRVPNLVVAAGHGMWGMILAPVTARMVQDAVTGSAEGHTTEGPNTDGTTAHDDGLGPDRFTPSTARATNT